MKLSKHVLHAANILIFYSTDFLPFNVISCPGVKNLKLKTPGPGVSYLNEEFRSPSFRPFSLSFSAYSAMPLIL